MEFSQSQCKCIEIITKINPISIKNTDNTIFFPEFIVKIQGRMFFNTILLKTITSSMKYTFLLFQDSYYVEGYTSGMVQTIRSTITKSEVECVDW